MSVFKDKAQNISPVIYEQFKESVETGKWPDGNGLSSEQREIVIEAIILYEHANMPAESRTGQLSDQCSSKQVANKNYSEQKITIQ